MAAAAAAVALAGTSTGSAAALSGSISRPVSISSQRRRSSSGKVAVVSRPAAWRGQQRRVEASAAAAAAAVSSSSSAASGMESTAASDAGVREKSLSGVFAALKSEKKVRERKKTNPCSAFSSNQSRVWDQQHALLQTALIPFIVAGDPDLDTTARALRALDAAGADMIELGVPYSDPLADGPVIQVAPTLSAPLILFTYYNPIMKWGLDRFIGDIKQRGAAGLVVPDVPLEETGEMRRVCKENGIELVLFVAGVTGVRQGVESRVETLLSTLRKVTDKPVAVGFGISKPEHAVQVQKWGADGVIVGSALVRLLGEASSPDKGVERMVGLLSELRTALDQR
eukprot:jgi/Chlat1/2424/Chrsp17S02828